MLFSDIIDDAVFLKWFKKANITMDRNTSLIAALQHLANEDEWQQVMQ